ncbi:MAG: exopolysaccharide biosynthesis protein [Methylophilales bacterium]|nr:exopolysaccharide biosynthesis protein [Methylophilales bacterium]
MLKHEEDELVTTLHRFADLAGQRPLSFGEAMDTLDGAAYALIAIILVLPFLQPIPLGPLTVLAGIAFFTLGWQMLQGNAVPKLPARIRAVELSEKNWRLLVKVGVKVLQWCRLITRPRLTHLVSGRLGQKIGGGILLSAGLLMAIPFGVLPLNNILPGLGILFYCIGELKNDGLMVFISAFWLLVTVVYFTVFFLALWYFGNAALAYFRFW